MAVFLAGEVTQLVSFWKEPEAGLFRSPLERLQGLGAARL